MADIRTVLVLPDSRLRLVSEPVARIDAEIRALVADMFETMYAAPGVGLAAIQVCVQKRVVTIDVSRGEEKKKPIALINPELVWASDERVIHEEGCLSIPDYLGDVERAERVKVRYLDLEGAAQEIEAQELFARVVQHEIDHINGVLFIDHLSRLKRDRVIKKFAKVAKRAAVG
ncbi:MAG: peptide deformylase [Xanthobacteraceae bacterium]|nr:peptide deformylase [Xanthobacteraceae bacterium]